MARSTLTAFVGLVASLAIVATGAAKPAAPKPGARPRGVPSLRPISATEADQLVKRLSRFEVKPGVPLVWSWPAAGNCNHRALAAGVCLAGFDRMPDEFTNEVVKKVFDRPEIDFAEIDMTMPSTSFRSTLRVPGRGSGKPAVTLSRDMPGFGWPNHTATVVNVEGTLKVVDPTASRKRLLTVPEWLATYMGASGMAQAECVSRTRYVRGEALNKGWAPPKWKEKNRYLYHIEKFGLKDKDDGAPEGGWRRYDLGAAQWGCIADHGCLTDYLTRQGVDPKQCDLTGVRVQIQKEKLQPW